VQLRPICLFVGEAKARDKFERGYRTDVSAPIILVLNTEVLPKNIGIGNGVERRADPVNADDSRTNQVGWIVVMAMEVIVYPRAVGACSVLGVRRYQCPEELKAIVIDGMIVK
jgi:hypothetical protein